MQGRAGAGAWPPRHRPHRLRPEPVAARPPDRAPLQPRRRHPRQEHIQQGRPLRLQLAREAPSHQEAEGESAEGIEGCGFLWVDERFYRFNMNFMKLLCFSAFTLITLKGTCSVKVENMWDPDQLSVQRFAILCNQKLCDMLVYLFYASLET